MIQNRTKDLIFMSVTLFYLDARYHKKIKKIFEGCRFIILEHHISQLLHST